MSQPYKEPEYDIKINTSTHLRAEDDASGTPILKNQNSTSEVISHSPSVENTPTMPSYKSGYIRWFVLFNACCFLIGSYFCFDNPGPIEKTLEEDLKIS